MATPTGTNSRTMQTALPALSVMSSVSLTAKRQAAALRLHGSHLQGANRRPARQIVLTPQMLAQLLHLQHTTGFGDRRRVVPSDFGLSLLSLSRIIVCRRTRNVSCTSSASLRAQRLRRSRQNLSSPRNTLVHRCHCADVATVALVIWGWFGADGLINTM